MKKMFLLPVMALMLCVISCEDDKGSDNSSSSNPSNFKKLVNMSISSTLDGDENITFSYDRNGNLASVIWDGEFFTQYSWEGEEITVSGDDYEDEYSYTVKNGKIVQKFDFSDGDITTFAYDESGHLIKASGEDEEYRYIWSNGRLSGVVHETDLETNSYNFYYSDEECKGFSEPICSFISGDDILERTMPQLFGHVQTALPSKVVWYYMHPMGVSTTTYTYEYTFYEDGYLKSYTRTNSSEYYDNVATCYFKWQ